MTRVLFVVAVAGLLVSCSGEASIPLRKDFMAEVPKDLGPDPDFQHQVKKWLADNEAKAVTLPSGVKYVEIMEGVPLGKMITQNHELKVIYAGWLESGKRFDASYVTEGPGSAGTKGPDKPATFTVAQVIKGWQEGMQGMKEGARRILSIPAEHAYGTTGYGSQIPPNSNLVFDVMLCEIVKDLPPPEAPKPPDPDVDHTGHDHK